MRQSIEIRTKCSIGALLISGCNPVISIAGANFPVWMLCLFAGILVSLSLRPVLVAIGIDEWMTPRPLIYSCLALVIAFVCWLVIWR
jgi:YtcA-like protein